MPSDPSDLDLSDYAADVKRFCEENSTDIIENRDRGHAAVLISTLIDNANKEVLLFCRNLDGQFYDSRLVSQSILAAVDRGVKFRILTQEYPQAEGLISELSRADRVPKVEIRQSRSGSPAAESKINFTVVDGKAFRLETNLELGEAMACANSPQNADTLISIFESYQPFSDALPVSKVS